MSATPAPSALLPVEQALAVVDEATGRLSSERVELLDAAGRVLAEPVVADADHPGHDDSAMDGFAVRADDVAAASTDAPVRLRVVGEAPAGAPWGGVVGAGEAVRIFTGGLIPEGADAIVPVEATSGPPGGERSLVDVAAAAPAGAHIRRAGSDLRRGEPLLDAGAVLDAGVLGVLATVGVARPLVVRRPRVALLLSGDEVVGPETTPGPGQVRDVSSYTLAPSIAAAGGEVVLRERVPDDRDALRGAVGRAMAASDVLISVGGVSMGERDLLRPALAEAGLRESFWKVAQRPGKPLVFGRLPGGQFYFGLPGNPISAWTCFHVHVAPALRRMGGREPWHAPRLRVVAGEPLATRGALTIFLRVRVQAVGGRLTAYLTGPQGSHVVSSLIGHDALMIVPPEVQEVVPGASFEAIPVREGACLAAMAEASRQVGR